MFRDRNLVTLVAPLRRYLSWFAIYLATLLHLSQPSLESLYVDFVYEISEVGAGRLKSGQLE